MMRNIELIRENKGIWPHLRHIWPFDNQYELLTEEQLDKFLPVIANTVVKFPDGREVRLKDLYNVSPLFDCEDFAIVAMAIERLYLKLLVEDGKMSPHPRVFGMAAVTEYRGIPMRHAITYVRLDTGAYFVDFSDDMVRGRTWKADPEQDHPFFLFF